MDQPEAEPQQNESIGPGKTSFTVHKLSISAKAPFFEKATSSDSDWIEARENTVALSDTEPEVFEAYLHWTYSKEVEVDSIIVPWKPMHAPSYMGYVKLWAFADMVLDLDLCNRIMDLMVAKHNRGHTIGRTWSIRSLWDRAPPGSRLRTMLIDLYTAKGNAVADWRENGRKFSKDFMHELSLRHLTGDPRCKISKNMSKGDICARCHLHPVDAIGGE